MSRIPQQRSGLDRRTISSEQQVTGINVLSLLPQLISDIPELVVLGRRNRRVTRNPCRRPFASQPAGDARRLRFARGSAETIKDLYLRPGSPCSV